MSCPRFTLEQARRAARAVRLPRAASARDLLAGMNVEREHSDIIGCSPTMAARIAAAHLRETPGYYRRLKKAGL